MVHIIYMHTYGSTMAVLWPCAELTGSFADCCSFLLSPRGRFINNRAAGCSFCAAVGLWRHNMQRTKVKGENNKVSTTRQPLICFCCCFLRIQDFFKTFLDSPALPDVQSYFYPRGCGLTLRWCTLLSVFLFQLRSVMRFVWLQSRSSRNTDMSLQQISDCLLH